MSWFRRNDSALDDDIPSTYAGKPRPSHPVISFPFLKIGFLRSKKLTMPTMRKLIPWTLSTAAAAVASLGNSDLQQPLTSSPFPQIPPIGFGTWLLDKSNVSEAVSAAIQTGYRHLDCATIYGNQKEVGKGIADGLKKANLKRSDIWVTSKLWNDQ